MEELMKSVYGIARDNFIKKSVMHRCDVAGCKDQMIVIDGNEKLYRSICASERLDKKQLDQGLPNLVIKCINTPDIKNKTFFCKDHALNVRASTDRLDFKPITRSYAKKIESVIGVEGECKQYSNITKYVVRTAGMFYGFRPCGYRVFNAEMYTAEALR
ncbi:uncharacterized protein LOC111715432 [Eurytemora carolleeae]|uniref:uncharacterized protein LOC111715432 n=1 Tax=Eurytemora carolleeae TaxID=1294199 RepID=UPI000C75B382|nr:uncharacterized protein LOC111715432 [Eurytemora carolleeae]|eukprot:XP_023346521.1 uncharacterized protein LOC111715432 [Eurytemora affinis]